MDAEARRLDADIPHPDAASTRPDADAGWDVAEARRTDAEARRTDADARQPDADVSGTGDAAPETSYDGVEATVASCEGCQARWAVIDELCARGNTDSLETIEAGTVCVEVDEP